MSLKYWPAIACTAAFMTGCQSNNGGGDILSQQFVHKYGFDLSEEEWEERAHEGQVITMLKNGVKVVRTFENSQLHGPTTHTFPHSSIIEKLQVYDQGSLLKEVTHDLAGVPIREEIYEFDDRKIITLWDEKGAPLSIEEYDDELLQESRYYTPEHDLEAQVDSGFGSRIKRDRSGLLLYCDRIEEGIIAERTSYHPNGQIHTLSHYHDYQLHGEQTKYTATGKPLLKLDWNHGVLDGMKVIYRNGNRLAEIPYINGQKHGIELHYDDLGHLTAEVQWKNDKKHGCSLFHSEESTDTEWFFKGQAVTAQKFETLEMRDQIIAEFSKE